MKDKTIAVLGCIVAVCLIFLGLFVLPMFVLQCIMGFFTISIGIFVLSHHFGNLYRIVG